MAKAILGKKLGMTQVFSEEGHAVPVTVIEAGPCVVVQRRTLETDNYEALQIGFGERSQKHTNMPMSGHFAKAGVSPQRTLCEVPVPENGDYDVGDTITVDIFEPGETVDVTGTSKGRGFAGVMKRHGFHGGPGSHGSKVHRVPQSSGGTDAARVFKGTRKPGHMGNARVTTRGLKVVRVDAERSLLLVKGHVPGARGGIVLVRGR
ncbi:MAG: 50S ribosomal protein L3 [Armatimonadota bacterium]